MGTVFPHVDDGALRTCGGDTCHQCERTGRPIYDYHGEIVNPDLARSPDLARQEPDVSELCSGCLTGGNVRRYADAALLARIDQFAASPERALSELDALPGIPLFLQDFDWPLCCGEWTTFAGSPADMPSLLALQAEARYWERGPSDRPRDFARTGSPESLAEVSAFRCETCKDNLYTDQFT